MKVFTVLFSLALAVLGTAIPSSFSSASTAHTAFSFVDWIDSVIADPSTALSPEEAVAAFNTSLVTLDNGAPPWGKCEVVWNYPAPVDDAVWCINDLAGRGRAGQICNVNDIGPLAQCTHGFMAVWTERRFKWAPTSVNCNDIARAGGIIMDHCTTGDSKVAGRSFVGNMGVEVHIN